MVVVLGRAHEKSRFREAVFKRDALQEGVVQPAGERNDGRRVAGEDGVGEGIDPVEREIHQILDLGLGCRYARNSIFD
jgi:hypothetical protein